jgi:transposase
MSNPILLPANFATYNFALMAKREKNPRNRIRLLAMANIQDGKTLKQVSELFKVHWNTIQTWLRNFRNFGIEHLYVKTSKARPSKISKQVEDWIADFVTMLSTSETGGCITGKQLQEIVQSEFSITCCLRTIYNVLHRLNFSWISSRSKHPKSDAEVQALYKKFSAATKRAATT